MPLPSPRLLVISPEKKKKKSLFGISRELQSRVHNHGEPYASPSTAKEEALFNRGEKEVGRATVNRGHGFSLAESLMLKKRGLGDFPGGPMVKNPPTSAGDLGSIPDPGRPHRLRVELPGKPTSHR